MGDHQKVGYLAEYIGLMDLCCVIPQLVHNILYMVLFQKLFITHSANMLCCVLQVAVCLLSRIVFVRIDAIGQDNLIL